MVVAYGSQIGSRSDLRITSGKQGVWLGSTTPLPVPQCPPWSVCVLTVGCQRGCQQFELGRHQQRRLGRRPDRLAEGPPSRVRPAQQRPDPQRALTAIRSLSSFAALRHPEHALLLQRVLAIPPKRFDKRIVSFLTAAEITALISVRRLVSAARRAGRGAAGVGVGRGGSIGRSRARKPELTQACQAFRGVLGAEAGPLPADCGRGTGRP
jgi:hypothetical protein